MRSTYRGAAGRCLLVVGVLSLAACGEPMGIAEVSTFTADVRGAMNARITGTAAAGADEWARQFATQVTVPNGETVSVIALAGSGGQTISFSRAGSGHPVGTHRLGFVVGPNGRALRDFSGAYVLRQTNGLKLFMADSGTLTITESGSRVIGSFTLYADRYDVLPLPIPAIVGKPITPLESGSAPLTISGTFNATKR